MQYKFQSMHPGGRTCVNSLFPAFNNIFDKVIEGQNVSDSEKEAIKEYILYRYKTQIDNLQECDCNSMVERLRDYRD